MLRRDQRCGAAAVVELVVERVGQAEIVRGRVAIVVARVLAVAGVQLADPVRERRRGLLSSKFRGHELGHARRVAEVILEVGLADLVRRGVIAELLLVAEFPLATINIESSCG